MRERKKELRQARDLEAALEALTADELRAFLRDWLDRLEDRERSTVEDMLLARATRSGSGWRPRAPAPRAVAEAEEFVAAARKAGAASPAEVDAHLRRGMRAFRAGDFAAARGIFAALLPPIAEGEIHLGEDEMVDEVLTVPVHDCVVMLLGATFATEALAARADALLAAHALVQGLSYVAQPIRDMERIGGPLPELDAFLPLWIKHLERTAAGRSQGWKPRPEPWLREAVLRVEGTAGLARLARASKKPEDLSAWCQATVGDQDWGAALAAFDEAAHVAPAQSRGEFLDGAALAARELGRTDLAARLQRAWQGAPTLSRLLRWLDAGEPTGAALAKRASAAVPEASRSPQLLGPLRLLAGEPAAAAGILAKASGLGWSHDGHPGHVVFASIAWLLAEGSPRGPVAEPIRVAPSSWEEFKEMGPVEPDDDGAARATGPRLSTPPVIRLLERSDGRKRLVAADRTAMLDAMRAAARARVEGVLREKRRRHYEHAAHLVACCVELQASAGETARLAGEDWLAEIQERTSRFPAFREALARALGDGKVPGKRRR